MGGGAGTYHCIEKRELNMLSISAPAAQPGSAESADLAARNLEQRLMTSGHERWEGDACTFYSHQQSFVDECLLSEEGV